MKKKKDLLKIKNHQPKTKINKYSIIFSGSIMKYIINLLE